jgi:phosphoglycolate phosphatase
VRKGPVYSVPVDKGYDGLIFDLDGTLWDSSAACAKGWNQALGGLGVKDRVITDRDIQGIMGLPHEEIFRKVFPEASKDQQSAIGDACYERELAVLKSDGGALFPGVGAGLKKLAVRYPLFIVSNCMQDYLATFLGASGLAALFKDSECYGATGKPKGDNIASLVKRNRLESPAYIGDTAGDQIAAKRAGVPYFHVDYGFGEPQEACLRFRAFEDLTQFFLETSP